MPSHARKALRKAATTALTALESGGPAGGTLPPVEASRVIPLRLATSFPRTLIYTRQDAFEEQVQESPYVERRRIRLVIEIQARVSVTDKGSGEGSQDQLDDWAQEIEDVILRLTNRAVLEAAGMGPDDVVEDILFAESDATATVEGQQPLTGIVLGFDAIYLHRPGDRTGYDPASVIKMDASENATPDVDGGDVQAETGL